MGFGIKLKVWGDYACFTRPEMKVERVSYDVITPSAARGVLEAIYWKPAIYWVIDKIHVLNPIKFTNIRRNELGGKIPRPSPALIKDGGNASLGIFIEDIRQQRASMVLQDVAYLIEAHFEFTTADDNNEGKHLDMFNRRADKGQCFNQPYLGCREFSANFRLLAPDEPLPASHLSGVKDLGFMLHDIDYKNDNQARFFRAEMNDGVISVPPFESKEVLA
jgi:CRISPR-associated protein Cas5d